MNLFDQLVLQAMKNKAELAPLRVVVEKELLQHDIIREMSIAGLLDTLTFIGGTCLRACYGSSPDERDKCLSQIIFLKKTRKLSVRH